MQNNSSDVMQNYNYILNNFINIITEIKCNSSLICIHICYEFYFILIISLKS